MDSNEVTLVLACSVRHRCSASWTARFTGSDELHLPDVPPPRVELIVSGEVWSATGAELAKVEADGTIVVRWWFSGGDTLGYALLVYAAAEAIDGDRLIDVDSADGTCMEVDFGRWRFRSRW